MRLSRLSEEQMVAIPKEHEAGVPAADLCPHAGGGDAGVDRGKARAATEVSEAKRRRVPAVEDGSPRKCLAPLADTPLSGTRVARRQGQIPPQDRIRRGMKCETRRQDAHKRAGMPTGQKRAARHHAGRQRHLRP